MSATLAGPYTLDNSFQLLILDQIIGRSKKMKKVVHLIIHHDSAPSAAPVASRGGAVVTSRAWAEEPGVQSDVSKVIA